MREIIRKEKLAVKKESSPMEEKKKKIKSGRRENERIKVVGV